MKTKEEIEQRLKEFEIEDNEAFGRILFEESLELEAKKDALKWVLGLLDSDELKVSMNRYWTKSNIEKLKEAQTNSN